MITQVKLPEQRIEFEVFKNTRNSTSVQGKLSYRGPIQRNLNIVRLPRLKIDLTLDEPLFIEPQIKSIDHPYSDLLEEGKKILAYSYEELFAEKLRALMQRLRPRDLYDVVHIFQQKDTNTNVAFIKETLQKKCDIRSVPFPQIELIETHDNRKLLESEWATQLRHQMPELPLFESFLHELKKILNWLSDQDHVRENGLFHKQ